MTTLHRYLLADNQLSVDVAIGLGSPNGVDLRAIEEIDTIEADDRRIRDNMLRYISERE